MLERRERWFTIGVISGLLLLTTVPYLVAVKYAGEEFVFGGFLLNPLDGNTYLAKMYQGWRGDTQFTLPFTSEMGRGSYLNLFYLWLGHLARIGGIHLLPTFHFFRLLATLLMLIALYQFIWVFVSDRRTRRLAFILATFGSGLGWLFLPFGLLTSDFWVAEGYPFLSAYVNPHFPLSLALLLFLLSINRDHSSWGGKFEKIYGRLLLILSTILLAIISPFGVVLVVLILATTILWDSYFSLAAIKQSPYTYRLVWVLIGGAPILFYYLWITNTDPLLLIWNSQNQTTTPPLWNLIISFSPVLIFAALALRSILNKKFQSVKLLVCWIIIGFIMLYIPMGLQRRFMMGLYVPLVILAALWITENLSKRRRYKIWVGVLLLLVIPTNVVVLLAAWSGIQVNDPAIYHTKGESQAFQWIENNSASHALILASANTGLLIPAYTGRRVIYGHPYETVNAEEKKALVRKFFGGQSDLLDLDDFSNVDYIFEGPRERKEGGIPLGLDLQKIYENEGVIIYESKW